MAQYKPTVDKKAAEQMNLTVLRRIDPAVEEVLPALWCLDNLVVVLRWPALHPVGQLLLSLFL